MSRLKERLASDGLVKVFGTGQILSPKLIEIVAQHGLYDAIWIDAEHARPTLREIELASLAAEARGLDCFVRLPATDYATVMRPLEAGACGVMISMIKSPADADRAVRFAKFAPRGDRGLNGGNRDGRFGLEPLADYTAQANAETFVGVQIETAEALANVAEIASVPDVDLLFIGPADLSQVLGLTGQFDHPKCHAAIERIARACADAGKPWGIIARNPDYAARMKSLGCRMFVIGFDIQFVHRGIRGYREDFASLWD
jgi:2-dehydro-3-deoxyglucarate aldolase/4-hydroxy-2-oxoheptanedioate aldolase